MLLKELAALKKDLEGMQRYRLQRRPSKPIDWDRVQRAIDRITAILRGFGVKV